MLAEVIVRIAAEQAAEERLAAKWRPRCSSAGLDRCSRREVYASLGADPAPLPGRTVLIFEDGDWGEELTLDWLRKSAYTVHSEQMALNPCYAPDTHPGYKCAVCGQHVEADAVHGHIDAIVTGIDGIDRLLEHKTTSRFAFARWATGYEFPMAYVTQAALYIYGLRLVGMDVSRDGVILIKCKDTAQYMEIHVRAPTRIGDGEEPTEITKLIVMDGETPVEVPIAPEQRQHPKLLQRNIERWQEIARYRDQKTLPDRPYSWGSWQCDYCPFGKTCWEGYSDAAKAQARAGTAIKLTGEQADLVRAAQAAAEAASEAERIAKKLKEQVKVMLVGLDTRAGVVELDDKVITAKLDIRTRTSLDKDLIPDAVAKAATKVSEFEVLTVKAKARKK